LQYVESAVINDSQQYMALKILYMPPQQQKVVLMGACLQQ
jgi:hypothetical protein